jgi:hypothetical protein
LTFEQNHDTPLSISAAYREKDFLLSTDCFRVAIGRILVGSGLETSTTILANNLQQSGCSNTKTKTTTNKATNTTTAASH